MQNNKQVTKIEPTPKTIIGFMILTLAVAGGMALTAQGLIIVFTLLVAGTLGLAVAYKWPDMFVILALWTHFLKGVFIPKLAIGEFGATPFMVFVTLAAAGYGLQILRGKRRLILPVGLPFLILFMLFTTLSLLVVQDFRAAIGVYFRTVLDWVLLFGLVQMIISRQRMQQLVYALLAQAAVVVTWGIFAGIQLERLNVPRNTLFFWRQFQKNDFAAYLAFVAVLALATLLVSKTRWEKIVSLALLLMVPLAWMFTFSRGGFLAIVVSLFLFIALERRKRLLRRLFLIIALIGTLGVIMIAVAPSSTRDLAIDGLVSIVSGESSAQRHTDTIEFRVEIAQSAAEIIIENPILGVGFNQWQFYSPVKTRIFEAQTGEFREVGFSIHNRYLLIAANSGLIALAAYLGFLFTVLYSGLKARRYARLWTKTYLHALIAAVIGIQIALLFAPLVVWEWPTLGILIGLIHLAEIETKGDISRKQWFHLTLKPTNHLRTSKQ
ncbi:MAG TPA: hypothetical protein EYH05_00635 [Anaerolineae bacterium]|nr:hypothetical protein [Anaerolineae bacterium]